MEFLSAGVWGYSTWFSESSCISAMEAQAAGLRIVSSSIAALNETVGDRGILLPGEWTSKEYQINFINSIVKAFNQEGNSDRAILQEYAKSHFCIDKLAQEWDDMFYQLLEDIKINPIVSF